MKKTSTAAAAMALALMLTACGNSADTVSNIDDTAALSEEVSVSETTEAYSEESISETEAVTETEASSETEHITEEIISQTTEVTTEEIPENTELPITAAPENSTGTADLSDSDILSIINNNTNMLEFFLLCYAEEHNYDNFWLYIDMYLSSVSYMYGLEYRDDSGMYFVPDATLRRAAHFLFSDFEDFPEIPSECSYVTKAEGGYHFNFGDCAQRTIGTESVTCSNGKFYVKINIYEGDIYKPLCTYTYTLVRNEYYNSSVEWDLPFSIESLSLSPENYRENYEYSDALYGGMILEVSETSANIRSTPDKTVDDNIIGVVYKGDRFIAYGYEYDGYWYKIEYNGTEAYISHKMVNIAAEFKP